MLRRRWLAAPLALVLAFALGARAQDDDPSPTPTPESPPTKPAEGVEKITILFTSDIHGHYLPSLSVGKHGKKGDEVPKPVKVGGLSTIAAKAAELRKAGEKVLLFDSGDVMSGHPVCDLERFGAKGGALFQMMNLAGYDAWEIGNHDFDHGRENTAKLIGIAKFPTLCANLKFEGDPDMKIQRWVVLDRWGLKIGVFGLMTDGLLKVVGKEKVPGVTVLPGKEAAREAVKHLREQKCDIVIALTHCGSNEDRYLAKDVEGIDVILGGHDHRAVEPKLVEKTICAEAALKSLRLGKLELQIKDKKIVAHEGKLLTLPFVEPTGELKTVMEDVYEACQKKLEEKIAKLDVHWKRENGYESNIGDFFCDALLKKSGAKVSFLNSGGIRTDVKEGDVTLGDVNEVFPIENALVTWDMTGEQLLHALETNANASLGHSHGILQVGGVRYEFERDGKHAKIVKATVGGEPIDPKKTYTCISTDFVAIDQADKYLGAKEPFKTTKLEYDLLSVAVDAVREAGKQGPIKTATDGRIRLLKNGG